VIKRKLQGDMISIKSQFEVDEAFNMFRRLSGANQSLRLYLSKAPLQSTEDEGMAGPGMLGEPDEPGLLRRIKSMHL